MSEQFESSDLYLVAALLCRGHPCIDNRREGRRVFFVFEETEALRENVKDYFGDRLLVSALDYAGQVKDVKTSVFNM